MATQQTWNGSEPALQILVLPRPLDLPTYAQVPDYLTPSHCRLCLKPFQDLAEHLQQEHDGITLQQYRNKVLGATMAAWPEPISPQVLRTRLAAFKDELCDRNFRMASCACCARQKQQSKLTSVVFPPLACNVAPAWLPWTDEQWIDAFSKDAMLLKRPLFVKDGTAVLTGFRGTPDQIKTKLGL